VGAREPIASICCRGLERDIVLKVGRLLDLPKYKPAAVARASTVTLRAISAVIAAIRS